LHRFLWLITQNVDGLHRKAGSQKMTELHGCGHFVRCMNCGNKFERFSFLFIDRNKEIHLHRELVQRWLADLNAGWATGELGELRPDGDVDVSEAALHSFSIPHCPDCGPGSILKTDVVFFGDCVPAEVVGHCQDMVRFGNDPPVQDES
jgi:NAD+-dependent protein deacetylase sirtuin 4